MLFSINGNGNGDEVAESCSSRCSAVIRDARPCSRSCSRRSVLTRSSVRRGWRTRPGAGRTKYEDRVPAVFLVTRLQPIRTASEIVVEFSIFTHEPFTYQRIGEEAQTLRRLGMTLEAIGRTLGVDEKTVRKIVGRSRAI